LKEENDLPGSRRKMRQPFGQRLQWVDRPLFRRRRPEFMGQQSTQRNAGKAAASSSEKIST
jgi:hypothetical protein